jgi:hypothetical protein
MKPVLVLFEARSTTLRPFEPLVESRGKESHGFYDRYEIRATARAEIWPIQERSEVTPGRPLRNKGKLSKMQTRSEKPGESLHRPFRVLRITSVTKMELLSFDIKR